MIISISTHNRPRNLHLTVVLSRMAATASVRIVTSTSQATINRCLEAVVCASLICTNCNTKALSQSDDLGDNFFLKADGDRCNRRRRYELIKLDRCHSVDIIDWCPRTSLPCAQGSTQISVVLHSMQNVSLLLRYAIGIARAAQLLSQLSPRCRWI